VAISVYALDERPDLLQRLDDDPFEGSWPRFMQQSPFGFLFYGELEHHLPYVLVALDGDDVVGAGYAVRFAFPTDERRELPDRGWDTLLRWGHADRLRGIDRNAVSACEIVLRSDRKGQGLSGQMVDAMRANVRRLGHRELFAPVRPSSKHLEPHTPMQEYAWRTRADGLPFDPWLRVHVRAGAQIVKVAPLSMVIHGTLEEWRSWTGLPFDRSGSTVVPGALTPVLADVEHGVAAYLEPNVWVRHSL
jgi:hypothetical protein